MAKKGDWQFLSLSGLIVAQEAGAKITGLNGKWPGLNGSHLVVTNGKIHNKMLKLLQ